MKLTAKIIKETLCITILLLLIFSQTKIVFAETNKLPITIADSQNEVLVNPGESTRVELTIYNNSDSSIAGVLKVVDFIVNHEEKPIVIEDPLPNSDQFSAVKWMKLPVEQLVIEPQTKKTFDVNIAIPTDAMPGGRYAAVVFEVTGSDFASEEITNNENTTTVSPQIASLFSIWVIGNVNESALITDLSTPSLIENGPIPVSFEIANKGDIHIEPKGLISVSDWFGRTLYQEKIPEITILPDSSKIYESKMGEKLMIGRYTIKVSASYGKDGKILEGTSYIWIIPFKLIIVIGLTIVIILILINNFRKTSLIYTHDLEKKLKDDEDELKKLKERFKDNF